MEYHSPEQIEGYRIDGNIITMTSDDGTLTASIDVIRYRITTASNLYNDKTGRITLTTGSCRVSTLSMAWLAFMQCIRYGNREMYRSYFPAYAEFTA